IFFLGAAQELQQARGVAYQNHQHAGRERIESTGMAYPSLANYASHTRDDVVRGYARRLVEDQRAIHFVDCIFCFPPCPLWLNTESFTAEDTEESQNGKRRRSFLSILRKLARTSFNAPPDCSPPNSVRWKNYVNDYSPVAAPPRKLWKKSSGACANM